MMSVKPNAAGAAIKGVPTTSRRVTIGVVAVALLATAIGFFATAAPADAAYVLRSSLWTTSTVNVCFENPDKGTARQEQIVEAAAAQWSKYANLKFVGWGACTLDPDGILIEWKDTRGFSRGPGKELDGKSGGITLNNVFKEWEPHRAAYLEENIWLTAVHEFGHALGLTHEQNRPDTPDSCPWWYVQGPDGDWEIGDWDVDSVMNYCNSTKNGGGHLSDGDKAAARAMYPPSGTPSGKCDFWSGTHNLEDTRAKFPEKCGVNYHPEKHRCNYHTSWGWHCMNQ